MVQISQMVVGVTVCCKSWDLANHPDSFISKNIIMAGLLMYASYLALFVQFFIRRYIGGPKKEKKKTA